MEIPDGVTNIGDGAFNICSSLTEIIIPKTVTSIGEGAFLSCVGLKQIDVEEGNQQYTSVAGVLFDKEKTVLIQYPTSKPEVSYAIPNGITKIEYYAFFYCENLDSISIPSSVLYIDEGAFLDCKNIKDIYYSGSEAQWKNICIEEHNESITNANIHYNHTHDYKATVTEPTCTERGYTTYTCSVCGDSYKADFVDATGHDCEATVVAPTCEGYGYTENHCKHCDYTYISEIRQPLGHDDKLTGAKEATCTEPGYTGDMVCTRCGEVHSKGEEIPALGHDYGDWTTVKEADCFHTGLEERKCGRCGETEQRETTAETCPSEAYTDLDRNGWYHEYVDWVLKNGVMNGVGGGLFEPNGETTRAMLVMVLYRMAGAPDMAGRESSFTDVSADSWYGAAVIWASENGIVNGVGGGLFDPDASLTREQMAMMLYRFAGYLGSNTEKRADLSAYGDADAVSAFAQDAMAWAVAEGLVNGRSAAELAPKAGATRAELATILFRFAALQNA